MEALNQAEISSALQVYFNLRELPQARPAPACPPAGSLSRSYSRSMAKHISLAPTRLSSASLETPGDAWTCLRRTEATT